MEDRGRSACRHMRSYVHACVARSVKKNEVNANSRSAVPFSESGP